MEEEERQAIAAADTEAAKEAIATAEESRKKTLNTIPGTDPEDHKSDEATENMDPGSSSEPPVPNEPEKTQQGYNFSNNNNGAYDSIRNLPIEMYHYYHGSNKDIGTLIEVSLYFIRKIFLI